VVSQVSSSPIFTIKGLYSLPSRREPFAEHVLGMRIRRGEKKFNADAIIYGLGKGSKFSVMHLHILAKTPLESGLLCSAGRTQILTS